MRGRECDARRRERESARVTEKERVDLTEIVERAGEIERDCLRDGERA